jgi:hypothetical protein
MVSALQGRLSEAGTAPGVSFAGMYVTMIHESVSWRNWTLVQPATCNALYRAIASGRAATLAHRVIDTAPLKARPREIGRRRRSRPRQRTSDVRARYAPMPSRSPKPACRALSHCVSQSQGRARGPVRLALTPPVLAVDDRQVPFVVAFADGRGEVL